MQEDLNLAWQEHLDSVRQVLETSRDQRVLALQDLQYYLQYGDRKHLSDMLYQLGETWTISDSLSYQRYYGDGSGQSMDPGSFGYDDLLD